MLDILADAARRNPFAGYAVARRLAPVLHLRRLGLWMVFDAESVNRVLRDPETFSSRAAPPGGSPLDWLIFQDPPRHSRLRGIISRTFTPRAVAALEPRIGELARELLDTACKNGELDLVTDFASPLPVLVMMELLGMPVADRPDLIRWADATLHLGDTLLGGERAARASRIYRSAVEEMRPYLDRLVAERREAPRDDLLTRLVEAEVDGARLSKEEILSFFQLLLLAGTETSMNLISNTIVCLLDHPHQLARLRAAPERLPRAIEEVLRFRSPVQMVFRSTTRAVALHNKTIPAGALVVVVIGSANRDPKMFSDPARFDIDREPSPHLAFGHGIHYCIGAALARLEARVAIDVLLTVAPKLERVGPRSWAPSTGINLHGPRSLRLRFVR
jgi:Cytochrome P450